MSINNRLHHLLPIYFFWMSAWMWIENMYACVCARALRLFSFLFTCNFSLSLCVHICITNLPFQSPFIRVSLSVFLSLSRVFFIYRKKKPCLRVSVCRGCIFLHTVFFVVFFSSMFMFVSCTHIHSGFIELTLTLNEFLMLNFLAIHHWNATAVRFINAYTYIYYSAHCLLSLCCFFLFVLFSFCLCLLQFYLLFLGSIVMKEEKKLSK